MSGLPDPHCKPGRYLILKGPRNTTTRLPRKFLATTEALRAALTLPLTDKQRMGK